LIFHNVVLAAHLRDAGPARHPSRDNISAATAHKIDSEIRRLVEASYGRAQDILTARRDELEVLANGLFEFETLSGGEIKDLLAGVRPARAK
jgi:cell division protease FtsH